MSSFNDKIQEYSNQEYYPFILIPESIQKAFQKPDLHLKSASQFSDLSWVAGVLGALSLTTPIGWAGAIAAGLAILYDSTDGYQKRLSHNQEVQKVLGDSNLLKQYMLKSLKETLGDTATNLSESNALIGRYDNTIIQSLKEISHCSVKNGKGLKLDYLFTPDAILYVSSYNLWIDVEVDEPWYQKNNEKIPNHYIEGDRDNYRDSCFKNAGWIVIRFSEEQVATRADSCAKLIEDLLFTMGIVEDSERKFKNIQKLALCKRWNQTDALYISRSFTRVTSTAEQSKSVKIQSIPQKQSCPFKKHYSQIADLRRSKQYDKAIELCSEVIRLDSQQAKAYFHRGLCLFKKGGRLGDCSDAIQDFSSAIDIIPDFDEAYIKRGTCFFSIKDYDSALKDYEKAILINPDKKEKLAPIFSKIRKRTHVDNSPNLVFYDEKPPGQTIWRAF